MAHGSRGRGDTHAPGPKVGAAVGHCPVTEDITVTHRVQDGHVARVLPAGTALPPAARPHLAVGPQEDVLVLRAHPGAVRRVVLMGPVQVRAVLMGLVMEFRAPLDTAVHWGVVRTPAGTGWWQRGQR